MLGRPQLYGAELNVQAAILTYCIVGSVPTSLILCSK